MVATTADIHPDRPNRITVAVDYRLRESIKKVPGARWDVEARVWTTPLSWPSCLALRTEFGTDLVITPRLREWAKRTAAEKKLLRELRDHLDLPDTIDTGLPGFDALFSYQKVGAALINESKGYLVLDATGTGKTRTALAGIRMALESWALTEDMEQFPLPCLVVAPKSMLQTWGREILGFFPGDDVRIVAGTPTQQRKALEPGAEWYVMNYEALRKYSRVAPYGSIALKDGENEDKELQAIGIRSFIADEAHRVKSPKSTQTRALWCATADAVLRVGMTGTPIQDTPEDLWPLLRLVAPEEYPTKTGYMDRFCTPPDSPVLMADFTTKPIGEVEVGDMVFGFDKVAVPGERLTFHPTMVTAVTRRDGVPIIKATLSDDTEIRCTPDHLWLDWDQRKARYTRPLGEDGKQHSTDRKPRRFTEATPGADLLRVFTPSEGCPLTEGERGWLAGMVDGEGTITGKGSHTYTYGVSIAQSRSANPEVCDEIERVLKKLGVGFREAHGKFVLTGGRDAFVAFINAVAPWSTKAQRLGATDQAMTRGVPVSVVSVKDAGLSEVVSLTTETSTYVVQGMASHNCLVEQNYWGGIDVAGLNPMTRDEFFANFDARSRRVTKEVALPFLPPKLYETRWVTLPPKLRKAYREMEDLLEAELLSGEVLTAKSVLERANRLLQMANASGTPEETEKVNDEGVTYMATKYVMEMPSPKIEAFMDDVRAGDYDGQQVVVFSDSRQLIDLLDNEMQKAKISFGRITGGESADERQAHMDAFQRGEIPYILLTRAGGEGITLTAASVMVRLIRPWSLTVHRQVEDRVHRIGSERHESVLYVDYIVEQTVEEKQIVALNAKEERAQEILRDGDALLRMIRGEEEEEEAK